MKLYRETKRSYRGVWLANNLDESIWLEPIDITEEEIEEIIIEAEIEYGVNGDYHVVAAKAILSKLKGDDTECPECLGLGEYSDEHRRNIVCDNCSGTGKLKGDDK